MEIFVNAALIVPPLLVAVILHEIAHGIVAEELGDPTARALGRISLNPIRHIDPVLTILIPGMLIMAGSPFIFGGAKPVPIDPRYFARPRRDMGKVAIAGPVTNGALALASTALLFLVRALPGSDTLIGAYFESMLTISVIINVLLGLFNLLPVPPLDGGRIVTALLPLGIARRYARLEPFGLFIVVALLMSGVVSAFLVPVIQLLEQLLIQR